MSARRSALLIVTLLTVAACGRGKDGEQAAACTAERGGDIDLSVQWTGHWGNGSMRALFAEWGDAEPGVELDVRDPGFFLDVGISMLDPDPPVVAQVSYAMVPTLVAAGAIRPMDDCLADVGLDLDAMLPAAVELAEVDGVHYGAPASLDTLLLLYDRAAFVRAGLDPDAPPDSLDALHATGVALRDRAGYDTPISWEGGHVAFIGRDLASREARDAAEAWTRLGRDGLLHRAEPGVVLPPIGSGRAALQLVDLHGLWGYASAIADGQAPEADLGVAPLPGLEGGTVPFGGGVWVVSASATSEQVAAAARFIAWTQEPPQQIRLHEMDDLLPTMPSVTDEAELVAYWDDRPLLRDAWELLSSSPTEVADWMEVIGNHVTIWRLLDGVALGGEPFGGAWTRITTLSAAAAQRQSTDPEGLLRCVEEHVEELGLPLDACV